MLSQKKLVRIKCNGKNKRFGINVNAEHIKLEVWIDDKKRRHGSWRPGSDPNKSEEEETVNV